MHCRDKLVYITWGLWGCLGFYRGSQNYKKEYKEEYKWNKNKQYYYASQLVYSIIGLGVYMLPFTMVIPIVHEIHNLERTVRGIKSNDV